MKKIILILLSLSPIAGFAATASNCNGDYLQGTIDVAPYFKSGASQQGVELSHTHIQVNSAGSEYDVAIDNVFANDYDQTNGSSVPSSLAQSLQVGQTVQLCGERYTGGDIGIHWVHTNCGVSSSGPNGYVVVKGRNLTNNQEYCYLWPS
jgi:hypothetical protein